MATLRSPSRQRRCPASTVFWRPAGTLPGFCERADWAGPCLTVQPRACAAATACRWSIDPASGALLVGNLIPRKGVLPFIEALAAAVSAGDPLHR